MSIRASATAGIYTNGGDCIYVLDPTASKAFSDKGGSVTSGGGVAINSNASDALSTPGQHTITMNNGAGFCLAIATDNVDIA